MPPVASPDSTPPKNIKTHEFPKDTSDAMDSNHDHDLPARTGRDADKHEQTQPVKEDPATTAASEELRHTTLSDVPRVPQTAPSGEDKIAIDTASTPEAERTDAQDEEMRERISSPKKKRGRDQDEETKDLDDENGDDPTSSADGSVVNGSRSTRSEPEKKRRPRDTSEEITKSAEKEGEMKLDSTSPSKTSGESIEAKKPELQKPSSRVMSTEKPQTSASAFASSGFASLAASNASPFGSLGATKPSVFGGNAQATSSGFGSLAAGSSSSTTTSTTTSGFGALSGKPSVGFSFGSGKSSGFGGLGTSSVFGSKLSNGFAGGSGPKLSSFAAPGTETVVVGSKPAKAFGAPESEEDGASDEEDSDGGAGTDEEESAPAVVEDRKKAKITKVQVDDGEAGEATLLQLRAKLFALESKEVGWKERGVGTLKINVPKSCASYDPYGVPIPGSFDASGIEEEGAESTPLVRLVMRQENTHRVVLNTVILSGMDFQEKPAASTAQLLFTAFEGDKEPRPVNMLLKMSEANARLFRSEIDSIQRELSS